LAAHLLPRFLVDRAVVDVVYEIVVVRIDRLPGDAARSGLEAAARLRTRALPHASLDVARSTARGLGFLGPRSRCARDLLERNPRRLRFHLPDLGRQVRLQ